MECGDDFYCWVEINKEGWIRKIGQAPPVYTITPTEVSEWLGKDAVLYEKAGSCIDNSYGLGACAYLRRLIENEINIILVNLRELREKEGADEEELLKINKVIDGKDFSTKTNLAYKIAPSSLKCPTGNPFKIIHDELSGAVHGLDEGEGLEVAQKLYIATRFIVDELSRHEKNQKKFENEIKEISKTRS